MARDVQAWMVRVESSGVWYLNATRINPDQLSATLRAQIGARANCVVSFDAEPAVPFDEAIHAIELLEQSRGKVVLLTRKQNAFAAPSEMFSQVPSGK
jgi:biopolymer transport protein ExbD